MKADYLTLSDGRQVRVLWNMNALGEWTRITGKEMNELAGGKANVDELRTIAWCAAREGEEADGRKLDLDEIQFGRLMDMAAIVKFVEILNNQTAGANQKKSPPNNPLKIFLRKG